MCDTPTPTHSFNYCISLEVVIMPPVPSRDSEDQAVSFTPNSWSPS